MAGIIGIRAEDMDQVDALKRAKLEWPHGLPMIRPSVRVPVLVAGKDSSLEAVTARFGFTRRFASFNARVEKLQSGSFWKRYFGHSHALAALSYVLEWVTGEDGSKQPYAIGRKDGRLMMAPALFGSSQDSKDENAFALVTTTPNAFFHRFHDRMVAHCPQARVQEWLHPDGRGSAELLECVGVPADDDLAAVPLDPGIQKRQRGDWSALHPVGQPLDWSRVQDMFPAR